MNVLIRKWLFALIIVAVCGITTEAVAGFGAGVRGGAQFRGGTIGIVGGHIESSIFPLIRLRPNLEIGKKNNQTLINPNLDFTLHLNPIGIGPKPYVGVGVGIQTTRVTVGTATITTNKGSVNVLGGVQMGLAPFIRLFVEGKGVLGSSRTGRVILGITIGR